MSSPKGLVTRRLHEWVRIDGDVAVIGITDHAQEELGDVALIQLPETGRMLQADESFGEIESIKAVSELYSPVTGEVESVNEALEAEPELVNNDPYGGGWLVKIRVQGNETVELLDADAYDAFVEEL